MVFFILFFFFGHQISSRAERKNKTETEISEYGFLGVFWVRERE